MYFCFLLLYNFVLYKKKIIKEKQLFVVYNIVLSSIILYVAANSDNKALFVLAPLFFIIYLVVFQMSFYRSAIRKISILIRNVLVGMVIFTVLAYATQPLLGTIDFIQENLLRRIGFIDDVFILVWSIGLINEELNKYKVEFENSPKSKIIENVKWEIHDDE